MNCSVVECKKTEIKKNEKKEINKFVFLHLHWMVDLKKQRSL